MKLFKESFEHFTKYPTASLILMNYLVNKENYDKSILLFQTLRPSFQKRYSNASIEKKEDGFNAIPTQHLNLVSQSLMRQVKKFNYTYSELKYI